MKQNIMKKWIKALRSGKFKQGRGTLKQYNSKGEAKHCCLGVLCELYNDTMKKNKKKMLSVTTCDNNYDFSHGYCRFDGKREDLPENVRKWADINSSLGWFWDKSGKTNCLADLNDDGKIFNTIADIIEKNWKDL